jgi:hypothetical protein
LLVMDCSDPAHPKKLSALALSDPAYDLTLAENKIYVANHGSLQIIDVSDPSAPSELGNLATKGEIWDVSVAGDFAYLASTGFGLEIVNIADPVTPTWVAGAKTGGSAGGVRAEGNRVYLGDGINGLEIYDVTNPSSPALLGKYTGTGWPDDILLTDNSAYIADSRLGVLELDVTDPAHILKKNLSSKISAYSLVRQDNQLFVAGNRGLAIYDISNHLNSTPIAVLRTTLFNRDLALFNGNAFLASEDAGLQVVSVADPRNPKTIGSYPTQEAVLNVLPEGELGLVIDNWAGLVLLNLHDPAQPTKLSRYAPAGNVVDAALLNGNTVCVARGPDGMDLLDVTDPTQPILLSSIENGGVTALAVSNNLAFVEIENSSPPFRGLRILDLSNPLQPATLGEVNHGYIISQVLLLGSKVYLCAGDILVVDITDPHNPKLEGTIATLGDGSRMTSDGRFIYVAEQNNGLTIVDLLRGATVVGTFDTPGQASGVAVSHNTAFVAEGASGNIIAVDVTDAAHPFSLGSFSAAAPANSVAIQGDYLYVGDGGAGMLVFRLNFPGTLQVKAELNPNGKPWVIELSEANGKGWTDADTQGITLETSPDLLTWEPSNFERMWSNGTLRFADPGFPNATRQFYRAVMAQ